MAGALYLGSQKVCPVIVQGGSEPTGCVFRFPENVTEVNSKVKRNDLFADFPYPLTVDFNNVETISGNANFAVFAGRINGLTLKLKNLKTVNANNPFNGTFNGCTIDLENSEIDFSKLESVGETQFSFMFSNSNFGGVVRFTNLRTMDTDAIYGMFYGTSVSEIYFNSLNSNSFIGRGTYYFMDMLGEVTGCTVHFPSNLESVIGSWSDVLSGFSGTNTTVLFDLEATS